MSETTEQSTGETHTTREERSEGLKWLSGIASLVGLWIALSPFVYETTQAALWNNVVVGAAIFLVAGYNYYRIVNDHPTSVGTMSLVAILGLWALAAPFAFEMGSDAVFWSNVASGALAAILAGYVAYSGRETRTGTPAGTR